MSVFASLLLYDYVKATEVRELGSLGLLLGIY